MYKIVIVDDEVLVRVGIKSMMNWEENGYTIVGEASNGSEALTLIQQCSPHIVFVDLMMNKMNGFELITALKKQYPHIKIIVLSCYNDFQNVKEAMRLGANDYIFKLTITAEELLKTLSGIKEQIEEEGKKDKSKIVYDQILSQNLSAIKSKKIKMAIEQSFAEEEEFYKELETLKLNVYFNKPYFILLLKIDGIYELQHLGRIKEKDILFSAIENITSEVFKTFPNFEIFNHGEWDLGILINEKGIENREEAVQEAFTKIKEYLERYIGMRVSGGVSHLHQGVIEMSEGVLEAEKACSLRFYRGSGECRFYNSIEEGQKSKEKSLPKVSEYADRIIEAVELGDSYRCNEYIQKYISELKALENLPELKIRNKMNELLYLLSDISSKRDVDLYAMDMPNSYEPQEVIAKFDSIEEIALWMETFVEQFIVFLRKNKSTKQREEIIKIQNYIRNNLDKAIDIPTAAAYVNMSESYFSHIFKKEMGISFIDYVNKSKMEKAKELLEFSYYKVYEIGELLGFQNPTYFTMLFKKVVGVSPNDYKKSVSRSL